MLVELIDWCSYIIADDPKAVQGMRHCFESDGNPCSILNLNLDYGDVAQPSAMAQIRMGRILPKQWKDALGYRRPAALQVTCEHGVAYIDSPSTIIWFDDAGQHTESLEADRPVGEQLFTLFHHAVTSLVRKTNDLEDAYRARLIVEEAEKCFASRERLELRLD